MKKRIKLIEMITFFIGLNSYSQIRSKVYNVSNDPFSFITIVMKTKCDSVFSEYTRTDVNGFYKIEI